MRRMYGNLVEEVPEPEPLVNERTPASTQLFVQRQVRNFRGGLFKRSVHEGEDVNPMLICGKQYYNNQKLVC